MKYSGIVLVFSLFMSLTDSFSILMQVFSHKEIVKDRNRLSLEGSQHEEEEEEEEEWFQCSGFLAILSIFGTHFLFQHRLFARTLWRTLQYSQGR